MALTVFKTDAAEQLGRAGSIPVRLRHHHNQRAGTDTGYDLVFNAGTA